MIREGNIGIVDYGSGNIASLRGSLLKIGYRPTLLKKAADFSDIKVVIVPGVGAFPAAMQNLTESGLDKAILRAHSDGKRVIGICLGMHLMASKSSEYGDTLGLGIFEGEVNGHPDGLQIGWMKLESQVTDTNSGVQADGDYAGSYHYFNHSFCLECLPEQVVYQCVGTSGRHVAIVKHGNAIGIQFHPEKSQRLGLELLASAICGDLK